jgi:peptidoglycan hydrolase CwlO-like protein
MINFIKSWTGKSKKIKELEDQLVECNNKLTEKQEHINTTNAYWKKKLHEVKSASKPKPRAKKDL